MGTLFITGGSGFIGHNLVCRLAATQSVVVGYHRHAPTGIRAAASFDIRDPAAVLAQFRRSEPEVVVHTAAQAHPDVCEANPAEAHASIVDGTRNVVSGCREIGARLIHFSTDLVYDGMQGRYREEDSVCGINVYSKLKILAEQAVGELADAIILRVALTYGPGNPAHPGFMDAILKKWKSGEAMTFYTDQFRTPVLVDQIAECVDRIIARPNLGGTMNLGGSQRLSRYDFALELAARVDAPLSLLVKGRMQDVAGAPRGGDCSLDSRRIEESLAIKLVNCREGLAILAGQGHFRQFSRGDSASQDR